MDGTAFQWDQCFITGIAEIDSQHHYLVDEINKFGKLLTESKTIDPAVYDKVFFDLSDYAVYHFKEEEALMLNSKIYSKHIQYHFKEHENFLNEVTRMKSRATPDDSNLSISLLKFLTHWLAYHILGSDQSMARQIREIEKGVSPSEAYKIEIESRSSATGPLLSALNGLFAQVTERNQELIRLNQTLEERVRERTRALEEANQRLEDLAMTDLLTNLPNRRHALRRLNDCWNESITAKKEVSCMMIDADKFKSINDTFGHDAGDKVLKFLAIQLKNSVRSDDLVCRLGGDEFFIICHNTPLKGALILAEKIRRDVSELMILVGETDYWFGSVSIGVASKDAYMSTTEDLMRTADEGVYLAKRKGRNSVGCTQIVDDNLN
ncbi:MAG: bacteriohemerythrin [Leptospiraceae bacterium]|nr:bacteriohemerythrin [Leptospiraceae bacterium]